MADERTPEELAQAKKDLAELLARTDELNESEKLRVKLLKESIAEQEKGVDLRSKEIAKLKEKVAILNETAGQEESSYIRRIREQELEESRLRILELQRKQLEDMALSGAELTKEQQKQLTDLKKMQGTIDNMRSVRKANNDLLDRRSTTQVKIEKSILRIADLAQRGKLVSGLYKGLSEVLDNLAQQGFAKLKAEVTSFLFAYDNATMAFEKQFQLGPKVQKSIQGIYEENVRLGASIEDVTKAYGALQTTVTDFTTMSQGTRDQLADLAVLQGRLGVAEQDFAAGIQNSMKFYGQSAEQAGNASNEIMQLAIALGRSPGEMAAEFGKAGPQLAKFGNQGTKAFKDLSRIARLTGMEMDKILSMTNRFDTCEGAAEQAGKLNAALGGNMVNAMDLMTETDPAARFEMIRDAIGQTGLSFDEMSYYQKQYFAEAAGLENVSDLALMMSGNLDLLPDAHKKTAAEIEEEAARAQEMTTIQERLKIVMMELTKEFLPLLESFRDFAQMLMENAETIKFIVGTLFVLKGVMVMINAVQAIHNIMLLTRNGFEAIGIALGVKKKVVDSAQTGINALNASSTTAYATAVGALSTAQAAAIPAAKAYAKMMGSVSVRLAAAAPGMAAFGKAALMASVPLAIFMLGIIGFALAIKEVPWESLVAGTGMIVALGFGIAKGSMAMAAGLTALANPYVAAGALIFVGVIMAIAFAVKMMTEGFTEMFTALGISGGGGALMDFAMALGIIAIGGTAMIAGSVGVLLFSIALVAFAGAMALLDGDKLRSIADFAQGMAAIDTGNLSELASLLERVADAMESIPLMKAVTINATLQAAEIAARAASAVVGGSGASSNSVNQFSNQSAAAQSQRQQPPINVNVTLELDGETIDRRIIRVTENAQESGGVLSTIAEIAQ